MVSIQKVDYPDVPHSLNRIIASIVYWMSGLLLIYPILVTGQTTEYNPGFTTTVIAGSSPGGFAGGYTIRYTKTGGTFPGCTYFGIRIAPSCSTCPSDNDVHIDVDNSPGPGSSCTFTGATALSTVSISGAGNNILTLTGTSTLYAMPSSGGAASLACSTTFPVNTKMRVTLVTGGLSWVSANGYRWVDIGGRTSFDVKVETFATVTSGSPMGNPGGEQPLLSLYNAIHTCPSRSVCTAFDPAFVAYPSAQVTAGDIIGGSNVCPNNNPGVLTANPINGTGNFTYEWFRRINGSSWTSVGAASTYNPGVLTGNGSLYEYYYTVTDLNCPNIQTSNIKQIISYSTSTQAPVITAPSVCGVFFDDNPYTFQWTGPIVSQTYTAPGSQYYTNFNNAGWVPMGAATSQVVTAIGGVNFFQVRYFDACNNQNYDSPVCQVTLTNTEIDPGHTIGLGGVGSPPGGTTGGYNITYSMPGGTFPGCTYFGFKIQPTSDNDTHIDVDNSPGPGSSCTFNGATALSSASIGGVGNTELTMTGTSTLYAVPAGGGGAGAECSNTFPVSTEMKVTVITPGLQWLNQAGYRWINVAGLPEFEIRVETFGTVTSGSPMNNPGGRQPLLELYDAINTCPSRSVCTGFDPAFVAFPSAEVTGGNIINGTDVCPGSHPGILQVNTLNGTGNFTYEWFEQVNGGGWNSVGTNSTYDPGILNDAEYIYEYYYTVTDNSCQNFKISPVKTIRTYAVSNVTPTITNPILCGSFVGNNPYTFTWQGSLGSQVIRAPNSQYFTNFNNQGWVAMGDLTSRTVTLNAGANTFQVRYYDQCNNQNYDTEICTVNLANIDDCEDIYVDWFSGNNLDIGVAGFPVKDINTALGLVTPNRRHIKIAAGTYTNGNSPLYMVANAILDGGYEHTVSGAVHTWTKKSNLVTTLALTPNNEVPSGSSTVNHKRGIVCQGVDNWHLKDLTITVAGHNPNDRTSGGYGRSVYGVYVDDCYDFSITRCNITTGNASNGNNGVTGANGANGSNGSYGRAGNCDDQGANADGGNGGNGGGSGAGGAGAGGDAYQVCVLTVIWCVEWATEGNNGNSGGTASNYRAGGGGGGGGAGRGEARSGRNGGNGGANFGGSQQTAGGGGGQQYGCSTCCNKDGATGSNGANGANGTTGNTPAYTYGTFFTPGAQGGTGSDGQGGKGGKGGGGGAGQGGIECIDGTGGGGGGGGGGGQGSAGGTGGKGGGSALGIYMYNTGGTNVLVDNSINPGTAGNGGSGGPGGTPGQGGNGGAGAGQPGSAWWDLFNWFPCNTNEVGYGGDGGNGGTGGIGGTGGAGADGESYEIYHVNSSTVSNGGSVPDPIPPSPVTVSYQETERACTNSEIGIGRSGGGNWSLGSGLNYVQDLPTGSSYNDGTPSAIIYAENAASVPAFFDLSYVGAGTTTYEDFLIITKNRDAPIIDPLSTVCVGGSLELTTSEVAIAYEWVVYPPLGGTDVYNTQNVTYTFAEAGTYYIRLRTEDDCCGWSRAVWETVVIEPDITIVTQPQSQTLCIGATPAPLTVMAAGGYPSLQYQWQTSTVSGGPYLDISGATGSTYNPPAAAGTNYYVCQVSSPNTPDLDCDGATSDEVVVEITDASDLVHLFKPGDPDFSTFNGVLLEETCEGANGFTYYSAPGVYDKNIFAINWDFNDFGNNAAAQATAQVYVTVEPSLGESIASWSPPCWATWTMARYWNVTTAVPLDSPVVIRFYYDPVEWNDMVSTKNAHRDFYSCEDEGQQWFKVPGTFDPASDLTPFNPIGAEYLYNFNQTAQMENGVDYAEFILGSFSGGTGAAGVGWRNDPLPVELTSFTATALSRSILLDWITLSEVNNDKFEILKSEDGQNFIKIGEAAGQGTTFDQTNYSHEDFDVEPGLLYYYRLRQVDFDGTAELSPIVYAILDAGSLFIGEPIPNPTMNASYIDLITPNNIQLDIVVLNMLGQQMEGIETINLSAGQHQVQIDASHLTKGNYLIAIRLIDGYTAVRKMVVIE